VTDSSRHEAAEEQLFWPTVRKELGNGDSLADEAIAQEKEAKEVLDRLEKLEPADPEFDQLVATYIPAARQHIEFEETPRVAGTARSAQPGRGPRSWVTRCRRPRRSGRRGPHPHTPANPTLLKTLGPAVAVTDKLRDAVAGRGA